MGASSPSRRSISSRNISYLNTSGIGTSIASSGSSTCMVSISHARIQARIFSAIPSSYAASHIYSPSSGARSRMRKGLMRSQDPTSLERRTTKIKSLLSFPPKNLYNHSLWSMKCPSKRRSRQALRPKSLVLLHSCRIVPSGLRWRSVPWRVWSRRVLWWIAILSCTSRSNLRTACGSVTSRRRRMMTISAYRTKLRGNAECSRTDGAGWLFFRLATFWKTSISNEAWYLSSFLY